MEEVDFLGVFQLKVYIYVKMKGKEGFFLFYTKL